MMLDGGTARWLAARTASAIVPGRSRRRSAGGIFSHRQQQQDAYQMAYMVGACRF